MGVATAGVELELFCPSPGHQLSREGPAGNVCRVKRCGEMSTAKGGNCWDERKRVARGRGHVWPQEEAVAQLRAGPRTGIEGLGLSSSSSISPGRDPVSPGCQSWHMGALGLCWPRTEAWGSWGCWDGDTELCSDRPWDVYAVSDREASLQGESMGRQPVEPRWA